VSQVRRTSPSTRRQSEPVALMVTNRSGLRVSDRAFWRLCQDNPDLRLERTARGELIVMPPAGTETGGRNAGVTGQLWAWNHASGLGHTFDSSTGYKLPNGATLSPDASWIARERWATLSPKERRKFAPICPDFVVELTSPSDEGRRPNVQKKMREYIDQGARLGWLIDPDAREVEIYRPGRPVETLPWPETLVGEDVLPGFVLNLRIILLD
jgi:Uma2 family endonuclease